MKFYATQTILIDLEALQKEVFENKLITPTQIIDFQKLIAFLSHSTKPLRSL